MIARSEVVFFGKPYLWVSFNGQLRLVPDFHIYQLMPGISQRLFPRSREALEMAKTNHLKAIAREDRKHRFTLAYNGDVEKAEEAMRPFADYTSHFYEEWREEIDLLMRESAGVDLQEAGIEERELLRLYNTGQNSQDSVSSLLDWTYEID